MRRELANAVRKQFDCIIKKELPNFILVKNEKIYQGNRLYVWKFDIELYFYLVLTFSTPKMGVDSFTIECAWTRNRKYPSCAMLMFPQGVPSSGLLQDQPQNGNMRFRLGQLFSDTKDYWWQIAPPPDRDTYFKAFKDASHNISRFPKRFSSSDREVFLKSLDKKTREIILKGPPQLSIIEATKNIKPCVEDAVRKIIEFAFPYFEKIIEEYKSDKNFWNKIDNFNFEKVRKDTLIKEYGGLTDEKCRWAGCENKRLKKVAFCIEHLYESLKNQIL